MRRRVHSQKCWLILGSRELKWINLFQFIQTGVKTNDNLLNISCVHNNLALKFCKHSLGFLGEIPPYLDITEQIYHVKEGYLRKIPVERMLNFLSRKSREIHSQDWYFSQILLKNIRTCYIFLITPNVNIQKRIDDYEVTSVQSDRVFFGKYHDREGKKGMSFLHIARRRKKMNDIYLLRVNWWKIHWLSTNQNPGFLYKV